MPSARSSGRPCRASLAQRHAFDQLHRDVAIGVNDAGLVDGDDVRMIERGGEGRFAKQAIERRRRRRGDEHAANHFQRDVARQAWIVGAIHLAHAARPELRHDLVRTDPCPRGK